MPLVFRFSPRPGLEVTVTSHDTTDNVMSVRAVATLVAAWLIPGGGFLLYGRFWRGLVLFAVLSVTFLLGCLLHGGVAWPAWSFRAEGFNVINNITFVIQMGLGLPALLSLLGPHVSWLQWASPDNAHALSDLGNFYILVCGAMNYFVACNTYDRLFRKKRPAPSQEAPS